MARESKKKTLDRYRSLVDNARRYRDTEGYDSLWWRMIDLYRGKQVVELTPEDRITVNISFGTINVIYPSISVNYPKVTVTPTKPEDEDKAVILEALVNWQWKHFNYQDQFRNAVKDYLMLGHGWLKVGYSFKEAPVPLTTDEMDSQYADAVAEADSYAAANPDLADVIPTNDEIAEHLTDTKLKVVEDQPFVERVSPFDVFVDPAATTLPEARWICQRIVRTLSEVRNDEHYKSAVRKKVQGDMDSYTDRDERGWHRRDAEAPEVEYSTVWEFYDLSQGTMCVWAEGCDEYLVDAHPIPFAYGHPYVMLRNYDIPEYFYPMGDLEAIESLQLELNKLRSQQMQARKKFARKYMFRESAFGPEGRQALASDQDNTMVPVADESQPFADILAPVPQVNLPPDLYAWSDQIENDVATVSGVSEYQRGQVPETRRTATEAAIISDSVSARAADKLANIEGGLAMVARRVVQVTQQFVTGQQVFHVKGLDGALIWVPWTREDIQGEYDFEVEAGSTQPMNETVRRQTAVAMSQALAPFVQMGVVDPAALARHLLQFGFDIKNANKFLLDPMAQLQQQMLMQQQGQMPPGGPTGAVGGNQGAPMGGGYVDQETGNTANQEAEQQAAGAIPPDLIAQLIGQAPFGA